MNRVSAAATPEIPRPATVFAVAGVCAVIAVGVAIACSGLRLRGLGLGADAHQGAPVFNGFPSATAWLRSGVVAGAALCAATGLLAMCRPRRGDAGRLSRMLGHGGDLIASASGCVPLAVLLAVLVALVPPTGWASRLPVRLGLAAGILAAVTWPVFRRKIRQAPTRRLGRAEALASAGTAVGSGVAALAVTEFVLRTGGAAGVVLTNLRDGATAGGIAGLALWVGVALGAATLATGIGDRRRPPEPDAVMARARHRAAHPSSRREPTERAGW